MKIELGTGGGCQRQSGEGVRIELGRWWGGGFIDNYVNGESVWIELGTGGAGQRQ